MLLLLPLAFESKIDNIRAFGRDASALINGYAGDINRPWLDKHVIVVFDPERLDSTSINSFKNNAEVSLSRNIRIDKVNVHIEALKIKEKYESELKLIMLGRYIDLKIETKVKILSFWHQGDESDLFRILFSKNYSQNKLAAELLPEEDFIPQDYIIVSGKYSV